MSLLFMFSLTENGARVLKAFLCFSSMKPGRNWLTGWRKRRIIWILNWKSPMIQTRLNCSFLNTRLDCLYILHMNVTAIRVAVYFLSINLKMLL